MQLLDFFELAEATSVSGVSAPDAYLVRPRLGALLAGVVVLSSGVPSRGILR